MGRWCREKLRTGASSPQPHVLREALSEHSRAVVYTVSVCLRGTPAKLTSCDRDLVVHKAKVFILWSSQNKSADLESHWKQTVKQTPHLHTPQHEMSGILNTQMCANKRFLVRCKYALLKKHENWGKVLKLPLSLITTWEGDSAWLHPLRGGAVLFLTGTYVEHALTALLSWTGKLCEVTGPSSRPTPLRQLPRVLTGSEKELVSP